MLVVDLTVINDTPVFVVPGDTADHGRVYGGVRDAKNVRWLYPAYPPFGQRVLADLSTAFPQHSLGPEALKQSESLSNVAALVASRSLPAIELPVRPFEHQVEGLSYLYHHPRWALLWDPGVGKTKVVCDLRLLLPGHRMLVLAPRVVVATWLREVSFHSGGKLKAAAISGTREQKIKVIQNHADYDVLVTTYGTARTLGFPALQNKASSILAAANKRGVQAAAKVIAQWPSSDDQTRWASAWAKGAPLAEIASAAAEAPLGWLTDIDYRMLVADESHYLKQIASKQTKAALALSVKAGRRYILSGTPALGDPRHLYGQLKFLAPSLMPEDWLGFAQKFLVKSPYNEHVVSGFKNLHIINQRVDSIAIRRKKEDCLDLPPRQVLDVEVEPSAQQVDWYNQAIDDVASLVTQLTESSELPAVETTNAAVKLNKLAQILSGFMYVQTDPTKERQIKRTRENPRLTALQELLETVLANPSNKTIVWCVYQTELQDIAGLLEKEDIGYVRLDGQTSGKSGDLLARFDSDPSCRVLVGQIGTGIGFTANAAAYTIYYSCDFSLERYLQSIDRNYRAGQTKNVTVYRLGVRNSIDSYKLKALDLKQDISKILTSKIACVTCAKREECLVNGVEVFTPGCIYPKSVSKHTIRPAYLGAADEEEEGE